MVFFICVNGFFGWLDMKKKRLSYFIVEKWFLVYLDCVFVLFVEYVCDKYNYNMWLVMIVVFWF